MGKGEEKLNLRELLISSAVFGAAGVIVMVLLTAVIAGLVASGKLGQDTAAGLIVPAALLGGLAGGAGAALTHRGKGILFPLAAAAAAAVLRLIVAVILPGEGAPGAGLMISAAIMVGGLLASALGIRRRKRRRR